MFEFIRNHQLNIMLALCAMSALMGILLLITRFLPKRRKWILIAMEVIATLLLGFDRFAYIYSGNPSATGYVMVRLSNFMVFFLTSAIVFWFNLYILDLLSREAKVTSIPGLLSFVGIASAIGMILAVVTVFTGLYYSFDSNNVYHRGRGFLIAYFIPVLCPIIQFLVIHKYRKYFSFYIYLSLMLYIFVPIVVGIIQIFAYGLSQAKIVGSENVFDFSLGNPSIPSPPKVNESICNILRDTDSIHVHGYSMAAGFPDAREAVAADLSARFSLEVSGSEIFLTCGAAPALISVIKALAVSPDSEIIVPAPFFPEYIPFISSNGAKPVIVPANPPSFQIDPQAIAQAFTVHTQAVLINSPNNPSGVVFSEAVLCELGHVLEQASEKYNHPIYIISDEPYRELVYGDITVPFVPAICRNAVVCYSYSKSLSLPGERIGYVYVPSSVDDSHDLYAAVAGAARSMGHVCAPTLMQQVISRCASERPDLRAYEENRDLLYNSLTEMGYECVHPDGAFYLLVKAPNGDSKSFSEAAKLRHNLLVVPADGFGAPGYLRLSYCVSHEMILRSLPAFQAMLK